jgi:hypothetical protein
MAEDYAGAIDIEVGSYDELEEEMNRKLAPGWYTVKVDAMPEVKYSKNNEPYLAWRLSTVGNSDDADNGFVIYNNTMLAGKGKPMFVRFVEAFDQRWEGTSVTSEFLEGFIDAEARAEIVIIAAGDFPEKNEVKRFAKAE